jgi:hypothetical protein
MSEERDPFPTEDPREKGTSDQNTEESPAPTTPREDRDDPESADDDD